MEWILKTKHIVMKEAFHGRAHSVSVCCALSLSQKLCNIFKSFWKIHAGHQLPLLPTEVICSSWRREKFNGDTSLSFKVLLPVKTSPPVKVCVPQREDMWQKLVFSHTQRVGQNLPGQVHSFEAADSCNTVLQDLYREVNVAAFSGNSGRHW